MGTRFELVPSIIQNAKSGYYYAQFHDQDKRPSRKRIPLRTKNKRTAERAFQKLSGAYALGTFDPWETTEDEPQHESAPALDLRTAGLAVEAFLASRAHLRPRTLRTYRQIVEPFAAFLGHGFPVARIAPKHVLDWLATTRAKDVTRRNYNHHLGYLFRFLVRAGAMPQDVSKQVPLRKVPEQAPKAMTREEVRELLAAIEVPSERRPFQKERLPPDRAWIYTLVGVNVFLGLRRGELVHLQWEHVDFVRRVARVANTEEFTTKSAKERSLPLCDAALELLMAHRQRNPEARYVFEIEGHRVAPDTVSGRFKVFLRRAGLPDHYNVHSTRHTFGTWLAEAGVPLHVLQRLMGHCSVTVTERYLSSRADVAGSWVHKAFDGPPSNALAA